ncbi:MAG TPA: CPBP family intramembrane glutamic endopeptidase [Thermoanaerobaculia bacterium]|nr:CPBP family intramembrane glutamic endopeptidase [Thermoanaerobaculia bacterium]
MTIEPEVLTDVAVPPTVAPARPTFGAAKAFLAFVLVFAGQAVAGIVLLVFAMAVAMAKGENAGAPAFAGSLTQKIMVPLLISGAAVTIVVIWAVARLWAWDVVLDKTQDGIGLRRAVRSHLLWSSLAGVALAAVYLTVGRSLVPFDPSTPVGPLVSAAAAGGINLIAWAVFALAYAPAVEELFFRGLLFRGFTTSWGPIAGGFTVTLLFVVMHLFETIHYWPATVAIITLSLATLAARQLTGSIYPAIAVHGAYNATIVVYAFTIMSGR